VRGALEGEEFVVAVSGESITFGLFCLRPRRQSEIGYPCADTGEDKGEYECAAESGGVACLGVGGHEAQLESEHGHGHTVYVVVTDSIASVMLPASPPSHARRVRPASTYTVPRTDPRPKCAECKGYTLTPLTRDRDLTPGS